MCREVDAALEIELGPVGSTEIPPPASDAEPSQAAPEVDTDGWDAVIDTEPALTAAIQQTSALPVSIHVRYWIAFVQAYM